MKLTVCISTAIVAATSLLSVNVAQAVQTTNKLYRCSKNGMTTLCFEAFSTAEDAAESCRMLEIRARLDSVRGGGRVFGPTPDADDSRFGSGICDGTTRLRAGYVGFIKPCAPGGLDDWVHTSQHLVTWFAGYDFDVTKQSTYPLRVTTCPGGGIPQ